MARTPLLLEKWDFILVLGESGSGKGTLVENIKRYWLPDLESVSMGDMFRQKAQTDTEIKRLTEQGILIDDAVTFEMFKEFACANTPGLVDGYPRNRQQAIELIRFVKGKNWRVLVVDLHCAVERIIERLLLRSRPDDKLSIVYKRHTDYKQLHPFVIEEIKTRPDLFDVITLDGNNPAEITFSNFLLDVLRLVDMLYFYDLCDVETHFSVHTSESTINPAINRWICGFLRSIQEKIQSQ